jgi:hypothetical protein
VRLSSVFGHHEAEMSLNTHASFAYYVPGVANLGPAGHEIVESAEVDDVRQAFLCGRGLVRPDRVADAHHVVDGRLLEDLLQPLNCEAVDVGAVHVVVPRP